LSFMLFRRHEIILDIYINCGNDDIQHKRLVAEPGINALDALAKVAVIEYTPDESATRHNGSVVTAINGFRVDRCDFWMYYIFEIDQAGWSLPMCTPDSLLITRDSRVAWRYHNVAEGKDIARYGPLATSNCISKIKRCNRQF
jgi:hypothetical protein